MYHYLLCGLKVESDIAFPELTAWEGPDNAPADIEFRLGPVERLRSPDQSGGWFEAEGQDRLVFIIRQVGKVLIEHGRKITFDAFGHSPAERVRLNFIGTVQSILWHQRGLLPLHASTVMAGQQAIAVGGATRSGKSVVAAALTKQGCDLVADDFTIVDSSSEPPVVLPGYQKLRLWKDACVQLDLLGTAVAKAHPYFEKYVLPSPGVFSGAPPSLSDIFILSEERSSEFSAERLRPIDGMQGLLAMLHTPDEARALGRMPQVFSAMNAIVSQVRMWRIAAPDGLDQVERTARSILSLVEA